MRRREFIAIVGGAAAWPRAARTQQPQKVPRIGFLTTGSLAASESLAVFDALRQGLRERGYVEGQNIVIEVRGAGGKIDRFPALARELVALKVDVIVASNTLAARALQQATTTIPIVVAIMADPIRDGLVASLARPGGNATGLTFIGPELLPKRVALLKETLPNASRVAALWHPGAYGERTTSAMVKETEAEARRLGLHLRLVAVQGPDELDRAFSTFAAERADAVIVFPSPMLFTYRKRIVELATNQRLPTITMNKEFAELGALISYGASVTDLHRRSAIYVDKILKGAKPADLPIEQPTKFEMVINLKTAAALRLTIPQTILLQADELIE
jgi:ABC-type uncharacterized transport system substrate-binding protein